MFGVIVAVARDVPVVLALLLAFIGVTRSTPENFDIEAMTLFVPELPEKVNVEAATSAESAIFRNTIYPKLLVESEYTIVQPVGVFGVVAPVALSLVMTCASIKSLTASPVGFVTATELELADAVFVVGVPIDDIIGRRFQWSPTQS